MKFMVSVAAMAIWLLSPSVRADQPHNHSNEKDSA